MRKFRQKFQICLNLAQNTKWKLLLILLSYFILFKTIKSKELALFAFNGCYGHDILMRQIGDEFDNFNLTRQEHLKNYSNHQILVDYEIKKNTMWKVNWIQIFMYNFGFGQIHRPKHWHSIVEDHSKEKGN